MKESFELQVSKRGELPAFPGNRIEETKDEDGFSLKGQVTYSGLTKRELMAAILMGGIIIEPVTRAAGKGRSLDIAAQLAVSGTDALLEELEK